MLKHRTWTALVLLLLIIGMIFILKPPFFAIAMVLFLIASAWEWAKLIGLHSWYSQLAYLILILLSLYLTHFISLWWLLLSSFFLWLWATGAVCLYARGYSVLGFQHPWVKAVGGLLMLISCIKGIITLQSFSPILLLIALTLIWVVDSGAYFSGRHWGNHFLAARISPKKTWEGFWGGILTAIFIAIVISLFLPISSQQRIGFILVAIATALFSVIGDLFVSLLKRQAGLKDSGWLLPGHGGLLDRLDSTISAIPIFTLGFLLLKI